MSRSTPSPKFYRACVRQPPRRRQLASGKFRLVVEQRQVEIVANRSEIQIKCRGELTRAVGVNQPDLQFLRQAGWPVHGERDMRGFAGAIDTEVAAAIGHDVRSPQTERATGADRRRER